MQITDQLRRYIQEQSQDNKRILELIREYEAKVHHIDNSELLSEKKFVSLDSFQGQISPFFSRNLYQAKQQEAFELAIDDKQDSEDVDLSRLFEVSHINEFELQKQIDLCMQNNHGQATLAQVIEQYPIQYGLDEVLTYVKLACEQTISAHINQDTAQIVTWSTEEKGCQRQLSLPTITFVREL